MTIIHLKDGETYTPKEESYVTLLGYDVLSGDAVFDLETVSDRAAKELRSSIDWGRVDG